MKGDVCYWSSVMFEGLAQPMHLLVILCIALLVFGPSKLEDLGKGLEEGIRRFKEAIKEPQGTTEASAPKDQPSASKNDKV